MSRLRPAVSGNLCLRVVLAVSFLACAAPVTADTIFIDDFSADAVALNADPLRWTVTNGTVDIAGTGLAGNLCAGGPSPSRCVDLDGSTFDAGRMTSDVFLLAPATYTLSFWLRGNSRGGATDTVAVSIGLPELFFESFTLAFNAPWQRVTRTFAYGGAAAPFSLVFDHAGGDNVGIILDDVTLTSVTAAVPEPGTLALIGVGVAAFVAARRRRRRQ